MFIYDFIAIDILYFFFQKTIDTLSDLLADMDERTSNISDKDKDNSLKLQHMAEMLNESEEHVQRLLDQEKVWIYLLSF